MASDGVRDLSAQEKLTARVEDKVGALAVA